MRIQSTEKQHKVAKKSIKEIHIQLHYGKEKRFRRSNLVNNTNI